MAIAQPTVFKPSLSDRELNEIIRLVRQLSGISMDTSKRDLLFRRIGTRLKALNIQSFTDYIQYLRKNSHVEGENFINAVTTNLTAFFREGHHFDFLEQTVIPQYKKHRRLRIWSAGCSTGEEAYSIGISLNQQIKNLRAWDAKILATDIDSNVLSQCRTACYDFGRVDGLDEDLLKKYFLKGNKNGKKLVKLKADVADHIVFNQLNLLDAWPMKNTFDVIFCRNVLIYFDRPTQNKIISRFVDFLSPSGYLIIGHSERVMDDKLPLKFLGHTIYQKTM